MKEKKEMKYIGKIKSDANAWQYTSIITAKSYGEAGIKLLQGFERLVDKTSCFYRFELEKVKNIIE